MPYKVVDSAGLPRPEECSISDSIQDALNDAEKSGYTLAGIVPQKNGETLLILHKEPTDPPAQVWT